MDYFLTFIEGFASFISPCILPMIPLYISYFSGEDSSTKKAIYNSISFVVGFTLIFILMAVLASTLGIFISSNIKYIKIAFGLFMIFLGLCYANIIKINLSLSPSINSNFDVKNLNILRSFVFGILFSVVHTPCVGAFLASALMLVSKEQNLIKRINPNASILSWNWNSIHSLGYNY